jgi:hypothetical protein
MAQFITIKSLKTIGNTLRILLLLISLGTGCTLLSTAQDICAICGQPINGRCYFMTDKVSDERELVCSNCAFTLPRCYVCGLPIKKGEETQLPDGRYLCARDAVGAVLDAGQARQICADVKNDLDHVFSRFTSFPDNVDVAVIDRIDVDSMFGTSGHDFESPDLLGCTRRVTENGVRRYKISLMIGLPAGELKETCAHEYSHTWVGENVSPARHARIARDAEEGFCEMMGYLLMDAQGEESEKKRVLKNRYTRGQVQLFIAAEQQYGFDDILDWMRYGVTSKLEEGHLDEIKDVIMTPAHKHTPAVLAIPFTDVRRDSPSPDSSVLKLQGIMWGNAPMAIINGRSFFAMDVNQVKLGGTNVTIRCEAIEPTRVQIQNLASGQTQELVLPAN